MHVLGLPPAFVLSQDQTLKLRIQILTNPWKESSKGSLRFDEFPTNMKRRNPFGLRATRLLAYENARPSESRLPARLGADTQGLRRLRFPFFTSQCQRAGGRAAKSHTPEPSMEANPPSRVNDSRSVSRGDSSLLRFCPKDRAVAYNPAGSANDPREEVI